MLSFLNSSEPPSFSSLSCSLSRLTSIFPAIAPAAVSSVVNFKVDPFLSRVTIPSPSTSTSNTKSSKFSSDSAVNTASPAKHFRPRFKKYSNLDPTFSDRDDNGNDEDYSDASDPETIFENGVNIKIEKLGNNSRRIYSRIGIDAPLQAVWNILTDYERLADFIPGLALSQIVYKTDNHARLFQVGQQNLAFGLKFNAKGTIDCYEKDLERLPFGKKRVIKFKMIEGDFELFEGEWSIEQAEELFLRSCWDSLI
ncbi:uncharacterized protein LOC111025172 isoform X2 [Momordica charantia]|uniref:Uncharacterized protein LOC111025172 isoform X2 n=1 Tax=Momordica charantia TaxID=3673 RepID=A0A6J1E071_MOMCH|nr:uncharacterized protein LOC111025172 isoform X2 [Momordica charantia]